MTESFAPPEPTSRDTRAPLRLNKGAERRLRAGHVWVYSNEVDVSATPLVGLVPGQAVDILSHQGKWLGSGYVNPHSLICARLVSRDAEHPLDRSLLVHRLKIALGLRQRLFAEPYYRLVFGESDGLPGLVVDRYADVLVAQLTTAGMEARREDVVAALDKVLKPEVILLRNDSEVREREGLGRYVEVVKGTPPAQLTLTENGARFQISPVQGQKTGWFYDQRDNRARLARYVKDARVLDLFSYVGAWGVEAALHGACEVLCVDASAAAVEAVTANAELNGLAGRVTGLRADAFDALKGLRAERERFDVVILDPPAFIKRRKDRDQGLLAYRRLSQAALQVLSSDGMLISCSCSFHLGRDDLMQLMQQSARHTDRSMQILEQGGQAPDHPIHPAIPETAYLKANYARVLPSF